MRSSSTLKNIEVVFHILSCWVKIRLHTENQLPRLPQTVPIVIIPGVVVWWCGGGVVWCGGFITDYKTTPTKFVLSCFGLLVGLWQHHCYKSLGRAFLIHRSMFDNELEIPRINNDINIISNTQCVILHKHIPD